MADGEGIRVVLVPVERDGIALSLELFLTSHNTTRKSKRRT